MTPRELILHRLLDKYENSKHLTAPGTTSRRVILKTKDLKEYEYEDAEIRDCFGVTVCELKSEGLIDIKWRNSKVFEEIWLNLENVMECYRTINRLHPKKQAEAVANMVTETLENVSVPWIQRWKDETICLAEEQLKVPPLYKKSAEVFRNLLKAFAEYDRLGGHSVTMRAFSIKVFHDSKYFERVIRDSFLRYACNYDPELGELCKQEQLGERSQLAYLGIYARPELYELSGLININTETGVLQLSGAEPYGIALPSTLVDGIMYFDLSCIQTITFVENKTNYDEYLLTEKRSDEMVIFHGGFMSPQKKALFQKIASSIQYETEVRFWADIDLGGFRMFTQLQQIFHELVPMRMSGEDVERYASKGLKRSEEYMEQLRMTLHDGTMPLFQDAAEKLLQFGVTIEQECFLGETGILQTT